MYIGKYEKDLLKKGYSLQQIEEMKIRLEEIQNEDRDCWGPCCPDCKYRGQATKGCGLWCLPRPFPRPENQ